MTGAQPDPGDLHGRPTAPELLDATIVFLRDQLSPQIEGPIRHQVRIAVHALEVVAREMELGPEQTAAHASRLAELGCATDRDLADAIKTGALDDAPLLRRLLTEDTRDRLLVANPRWLPDQPPSGPDNQPPSGPGDQPPSGPGDQPPSRPIGQESDPAQT